jgi:rubrerythrin
MPQKTYWRCTVCGDLHYGVAAPETCPTCHNPRSKAEAVSREEFLEAFEAQNKQ